MTSGDPTADADTTPQQLAERFHDEGFVELQRCTYSLSPELVARGYTAVKARYDALLAKAEREHIDLDKPENAEVINGFYVRQGGRIDMQLRTAFTRKVPIRLQDSGGDSKSRAEKENDDDEIDLTPFTEMAAVWKDVITEIFSDNSSSDSSSEISPSSSSSYRLEYIGCVVSRPGDSDQNWHLDGVHKNFTRHERADRLNVFVPLVNITPEIGGTEMKIRSHFHDDGKRGASFKDYAHLSSVTHFVEAGTAIIMDYRVWHRGCANTSKDIIRPLLYFKYARQSQEIPKRASAVTSEAEGAVKKRKRIIPIQLS